MSRRLEFPDEFIFADGVQVRTPGELAQLLQAEPARAAEVWQRVEEGDLERWLRQGGYEALVARVAQLREGGGSVLELVHILRRAGVSRAPSTAQGEGGGIRRPEDPRSAAVASQCRP